MILSANEISALVVKAARGAGVPLGCAEDLGAAAGLLAAWGALGEVCLALDRPLTKLSPAAEMKDPCLAIMGPAMIDAVWCEGQPILVTDCENSRVMEALVQVAQTAGARVKCTQCDEGLRIEPCSEAPQVASKLGPFEVDAQTLDALNAWAAKTYVPATEASRLAGAGAGLTDND